MKSIFLRSGYTNETQYWADHQFTQIICFTNVEEHPCHAAHHRRYKRILKIHSLQYQQRLRFIRDEFNLYQKAA